MEPELNLFSGLNLNDIWTEIEIHLALHFIVKIEIFGKFQIFWKILDFL